MVNFNVRGYIIRVFNDTKIKIRIDEDDVEKIEKIFSNLYKTKKNITELNILLQGADIDIRNLEYNELSDLIGVYVYISCQAKYYSFSKDDEHGNKNIYRGYNIKALKLSNNMIK